MVSFLTYIFFIMVISRQWMYSDVFDLVMHVTKLVFLSIFRAGVTLEYLQQRFFLHLNKMYAVIFQLLSHSRPEERKDEVFDVLP